MSKIKHLVRICFYAEIGKHDETLIGETIEPLGNPRYTIPTVTGPELETLETAKAVGRPKEKISPDYFTVELFEKVEE